MQTVLNKDKVARDCAAMAGVVTFLSSLAGGKLIYRQADRPGAGARSHVPGHRPDRNPTCGEFMLTVQPVARLASALQVRCIWRPMTLAVRARRLMQLPLRSRRAAGKPIFEQALIDRPA
jgi:hypothetical protein